MNRRALNFGLAYALLVIIFKLAILLGGYTNTKFGFYYSQIVSVLLIIPFFYVCIKLVRDKDNNGVISGRDAIRLAFTILGVSMIILSLYNYIEFNWKMKEIAVDYYHSQEYANVLSEQMQRYPDKIKQEDFPRIIEEQIQDLSAFKATTGKLLPMLFIGLSSAFLLAIFLKRSARI